MSRAIRIRAFLAIELDKTVRQVISETLDKFGCAETGWLRLIEPDSIHLTLKFLGEIMEGQVEAIHSAVEEAVRGIQPFVMQIGDSGVFPNRRRPRVLWMGIDGDLTLITNLHQRLEDSLEPLGFDRVSRRFRPHLTLGKLNRHASSSNIISREIAALLSNNTAQGTPIIVNAVSLMRSILPSTDTKYVRLSYIPLEGRKAS